MRMVYSYQGEEKVFDSEKAKILIGRLDPYKGVVPDLDLSPDRFVSHRHACIWMVKGQYWIEDLDSKNGTFVEGADIKGKGRVALKPGVSMRMGHTMLKLVHEIKGKSLRIPKLRIALTCLPVVNYSLVNTDVPFLTGLTIYNDSSKPFKNAKLRVTLSDYAESQLVNIPLIPARGSYMVSPLPRFLFNPHRLRDLPEPETAPVEVYVNNERVPLTSPAEVKVLPANAWHCVGHEVALAGFVMPHSDAVAEIKSRARFELQRLLKGVKGWADAIESSDPKATEKTLKALYLCLQERYGITYEYEPRTYAPDWQMVRFHQEVLADLEGTCIDLALLFAACLESIHRDPLIIIVKIGRDPKSGVDLQHAVIGCWRNGIPVGRNGTPLWGPIISDEARVRNWVESGEILILDSKGFPQTKEFPEGMPFSECQKKGIDYVKNYPLFYAVDVVTARDAGITPMPFGKGAQFDRSAWLATFRASREAERLQSPAVGARHLLLGLLSLDDGLMGQVFAQFGKGVAGNVAKSVRASLRHTEAARRPLPKTNDWQAVIRRAKEIAASNSSLLVTEADLATALLETPSQVDKVLEREELSRQRCLDKLGALHGKGATPSEWHDSGFMQTV